MRGASWIEAVGFSSPSADLARLRCWDVGLIKRLAAA
jgi:hypothetical protein